MVRDTPLELRRALLPSMNKIAEQPRSSLRYTFLGWFETPSDERITNALMLIAARSVEFTHAFGLNGSQKFRSSGVIAFEFVVPHMPDYPAT